MTCDLKLCDYQTYNENVLLYHKWISKPKINI